MARANIFAASSREMGAFGRNVPSAYPLIQPLETANLIYSAYHLEGYTSSNLVSVHK